MKDKGPMIAIAVGMLTVVTTAVAATAWIKDSLHDIDKGLAQLQAGVDRVGEDRWTGSDMKIWVNEAEKPLRKAVAERDETWALPDPWEIRKNRQ